MIQKRNLIGAVFVAVALGQISVQAATALNAQQYHALLLEISVRPGGSADAAVADVRARTDNSDPEALLNLGRALSAFKAYPDSVEVLTRATELSPSNGMAFSSLGFAAFWAGNCDAALPALERALALDTTPASASKEKSNLHSLAGRCALRNGALSRAIEHCKAAETLAPADPRGEFCLGKAQLRSGNLEAALASFTKIALRTDLGQFEIPYKRQSRSLAVLVLHQLGRLDQASTILGLEPRQWPQERLRNMAEWEKTVEKQNLSPRSWQD